MQAIRNHSSNRLFMAAIEIPAVLLVVLALNGGAGTYTSAAASAVAPEVQSAPVLAASPREVQACPPNWQVVDSPRTREYNGLSAVSALSADDMWAVGEYHNIDPYTLDNALAMHWDGIRWNVAPTGVHAGLHGVVAIAPNDVWAVGEYPTGSDTATRAIHWDGTTWTIFPTPTLEGNSVLTAITALASDDVWAVGYDLGFHATLVLHWEGTHWERVPSPPISFYNNYRLFGVSAVSPDDIWAVGDVQSTSDTSILIEHWNGVQWSIVDAPNPGIYLPQLSAVAAVSANDVWAVGSYSEDSGSTRRPLFMHWNGTAWSVVQGENPPTWNKLNGVVAVSANDIWAVGVHADCSLCLFTHTLIMHWDGTVWTRVFSTDGPREVNGLSGVVAVSDADVWAVGGTSDYSTSQRYSDTLIERHLCPPPPTPTGTPPTTTPTPTFTPTRTATICAPANSNYNISQSTGATLVPGTADIGLHCNECATTINLPFPFALYGQQFNSARVGSNGTLGFVANSNTWRTTCMPSQEFDYAILPFWQELVLSNTGGGCPNCGIFTSVSGTTPNRIFNIEWCAADYFYTAYVNFEVRLFENAPNGHFEVIYASVPQGSNQQATVGVQKQRGQRYTQLQCENSPPTLTNGLKLTFTQPVCPTSQSLAGHVTWQGRPAQPYPLHGLPISLTLKLGATEVNYSIQNTDANGLFNADVSNLASGTYNWRVKGHKYLANVGTVTLTGAPTTNVEMGVMRVGDANDDNAVNVTDFNILKVTFGKSFGDPGYDDRADFTGDRTVNIADFNLLKVNFGQGGAPPIGPIPRPWPHLIGQGTVLGPASRYLPPASPRVALYDQYDNPDPFESGTSSQVFGAPFSDYDDQAADDFIVPAGQAWSVDQVDVNGYYDAQGGPAESVNVYFYADDSGLPGAPVTTQNNIVYTPGPTLGSFIIHINPVTLPPGAYWVSVQVNQDYTTRLQWLWADRSVQSNNGAAWQNPLDGFGTGCVSWDRRGSVCGGDENSPDQMFRLSGTTSAVTPTPTPTGPTATRTATMCPPRNYQIAPSTGATIVPGTTDTGNHCIDCVTSINLPFPYVLYDRVYTRARVGSNGTLQFNSNSTSFEPFCLPDTEFNSTIFAMFDDLDTGFVCAVGCGVYTSISGSAPNRIFNIEWRTEYTDGSGLANFEVRLYEGQPVFELIYGEVDQEGQNAVVGVQRGFGSLHTEFECLEGGLGLGLKLTFTMPACAMPTPTPTSTPANQAMLSTHVTWQGRPTQPNPLQQLPITLTLKLGTSEHNYTGATDASGVFAVAVGDLPGGTYNWRVKGPQFLANSGTVTLTGAPTTNVEIGLLRTGDCNNDNAVNVSDFNILKVTFGKTIGNPGYDERADFTGDQAVNVSDFNLQKVNFGQGGAPPIGPNR